MYQIKFLQHFHRGIYIQQQNIFPVHSFLMAARPCFYDFFAAIFKARFSCKCSRRWGILVDGWTRLDPCLSDLRFSCHSHMYIYRMTFFQGRYMQKHIIGEAKIHPVAYCENEAYIIYYILVYLGHGHITQFPASIYYWQST